MTAFPSFATATSSSSQSRSRTTPPGEANQFAMRPRISSTVLPTMAEPELLTTLDQSDTGETTPHKRLHRRGHA